MVDTTRYNTGNELGSNKLEDLSDNAKNIDNFSNSGNKTFTDRFGASRKSIAGMESEFKSVIKTYYPDRSDGFTFDAGFTLTHYNQVAIKADGSYWGYHGNILPITIPPLFDPSESSDWDDRTDLTLRSDLKYNIGNLVQSKPMFSSDYSAPVSLLNAVDNYSLIFALFCDKSKSKAILQTIERGATATSDAYNIGGLSCTRITEAFVVKKAIYAQLNPFSSSLTSVTTAITQTNWNIAVGVPATFGGQGNYRNRAYGISDYKTYNVGQNGTIEFYSTSDSAILFYKSGLSSAAVNIYTDKAVSGTYALIETISLVGSGGYKHTISANTKVKIENTTASPCYVIGVDVDSIFNAKTTRHYDTLSYYRDDNYNGDTAYWIGPGEGANEIAMRPVGGKFFCSYHGGHADESVSAFVDGVAFDVTTASTFSYGNSASVISDSTVSSDAASYNMSLTMTFASGMEYSNVKIVPQLGESERMQELFTCMTVAPSRFGNVLAPMSLTVPVLVGSELELTSSNDITQFDKEKRQVIRTTFTDFSTVGSSKRTPYIQTRDKDNKLYYNISEDGNSFFERLDLDIVRSFSTI